MKQTGSTHEAMVSRKETKLGSEKSFGLVFAFVFALIAFFLTSIIAAAISLTFLIIAFGYPKLLKPLNFIWFRFGLLLHHILSPIIMFVVYVLAILPTSLCVKLLGKDLLSQKLDPAAVTYWITKSADENKRFNFKTQF